MEVYFMGNYVNILIMFQRFEVFVVVRIPVEVLWVLMLCSVVVGYEHFGGPCYLHLQHGNNMVLQKLVSFHNTT
jgi:hypothetical protein